MFKRLKRKFILTNLITSTLVLFVAFLAIYLVAAGSINHRADRPFDPGHGPENQMADFSKEMDQRLKEDREASLQSLLISLIVTGVVVEIIVALASIYLAEQSIKPVREAYIAQKDFVANASHEIKTPLAIIQANLEAADIKDNKWLDNAAKKAEDLAALNNQLLDLARSESTTEEIKLIPTDVNLLAKDAVSAFLPKAESKNIDIKLETNAPAKQKLNQKALEQILNIYIDNAIKYGKKRIEVLVKKDRIEVVSDGKLIKKSELKKIFDRFYQTDKTTSGVGLGLSIARSLAEKNKWQVYAKTSEQKKQNIFVVQFK